MVQLPYTLQTWLGMVQMDGAPAVRVAPRLQSSFPTYKPAKSIVLPNISSFTDYLNYNPPACIADAAVACLSQSLAYPRHLVIHPPPSHAGRGDWLAANIEACRSGMTKEDLREYIFSRRRLDLEQAAGAVISALISGGMMEEAVLLVRHLGGVLATSCMWIETEPPAGIFNPLINFVPKLQRFLGSQFKINNAVSWPEIIPILLRVRHKKHNNRCLQIPEWIFTELHTPIPDHIAEYYACTAVGSHLKWSLFPELPPADDSIFLPRSMFTRLQRRIHDIHHHWKPPIALRRSIKQLESRVLFPLSIVDERISQSDQNALVIAHFFFAFQRRLQRKVVSDVEWTRFLPKGEGATLYQNNLAMHSTFEEHLRSLSGQAFISLHDDTMPLIDQTCVLMEKYVILYGHGVKAKLTFNQGTKGGSGRGPVDDYNLLCDILAELRQQAKRDGITKVPGPVHKFLAKDIMHWNNSWGDDAFAGGKVPGWEPWLAERRAQGLEA